MPEDEIKNETRELYPNSVRSCGEPHETFPVTPHEDTCRRVRYDSLQIVLFSCIEKLVLTVKGICVCVCAAHETSMKHITSRALDIDFFFYTYASKQFSAELQQLKRNSF